MLFVSCSPSSHLGKTSVEKPAMTETDPAKWQRYYEDQLDAYKGTVFAPASGYPNAAFEGYKMATLTWDGKVSKAVTGTTLLCAGGGLFIGLLVYLIGTSNSANP